MDQSRLSLLALHFVPGVGSYLIRQLISYCGSADAVFKSPKGKLLKIPGVGEVTATSIVKESPFQTAEAEWKKAEKENTEIVFFTDKKYPSRLKNINDPPSILYCKGNIDLENPKVVALVGTRQATAYGKRCTDLIIEQLRAHNTVVVSGLAYGIDIHAHKQAVKNKLQTIGVMGSGMDIIYPAAHRETAKQMLEDGGLITENRFGTKPDAHNFPARNRIIAGLCDALVVIEAAEKGGALITAEIANSYNRDVFAFPGNVDEPYSQGCNNLIKTNKAHLINSAKDIEYVMNWVVDDHTQRKTDSFLFDDLIGDEQVIVNILKNKSLMVIDELSWKTDIPVNQLASHLLNLEFKGIVQSLPGKQYRLIAR